MIVNQQYWIYIILVIQSIYIHFHIMLLCDEVIKV